MRGPRETAAANGALTVVVMRAKARGNFLYSLHHDEMRWLVESAGAITIFLPPYARDLNPIEKCFGRVKQLIQDNAEEASYNPLKVLNDAFRTVGPELAISYYQDMLRILDEC